MRRSAWIWLAGCLAWGADGVLRVHFHQTQQAELAFILAALFFVAWMFYKQQEPKR
jgi:hypothetical protein